ncbi:MAG: PqqD family protein [Acetatifactor sp.]|nr:PqqD family protein [Acetatifactor sp.]
MNKKSESVSANFLDFKPVPNISCQVKVTEKGEVIILQENKGLFNFIAQKLFKKPRISQIHLDTMGNYIWPLMDGKMTVGDIAGKVKEHFGDDAEPLYERLIKYLKTLESYGFIEIQE